MADKTSSNKDHGIRQRTHERVDKIMDKAESMEETGKEKLAQLKEKASMMRENVDGYIKENPEKSVLIAAGIGAVVGAIIVASMMRRRQ